MTEIFTGAKPNFEHRNRRGHILSHYATPRQNAVIQAYTQGQLTHEAAARAADVSIFSSRKVVTEVGRLIDPDVAWTKTRLLYHLIHTGELPTYYDDLPIDSMLREKAGRLSRLKAETLLLLNLGQRRIEIASMLGESPATTRCRMNNIGGLLIQDKTGDASSDLLAMWAQRAGVFLEDPHIIDLHEIDPAVEPGTPFFMLPDHLQQEIYLADTIGIRDRCLGTQDQPIARNSITALEYATSIGQLLEP